MIRPLLAAGLLLLAACASSPDAVSRCEGARRPANPHGSVLGVDAGPSAPAATSPAGCAEARHDP